MIFYSLNMITATSDGDWWSLLVYTLVIATSDDDFTC